MLVVCSRRPVFSTISLGYASGASHLLLNRDPLRTDRHLGRTIPVRAEVHRGRSRFYGYQTYLRAPKEALRDASFQ